MKKRGDTIASVYLLFLDLPDVLKFPGVFLWPVASGRRKSREFLSWYVAHPERSARQTPGIPLFILIEINSQI